MRWPGVCRSSNRPLYRLSGRRNAVTPVLVGPADRGEQGWLDALPAQCRHAEQRRGRHTPPGHAEAATAAPRGPPALHRARARTALPSAATTRRTCRPPSPPPGPLAPDRGTSAPPHRPCRPASRPGRSRPRPYAPGCSEAAAPSSGLAGLKVVDQREPVGVRIGAAAVGVILREQRQVSRSAHGNRDTPGPGRPARAGVRGSQCGAAHGCGYPHPRVGRPQGVVDGGGWCPARRQPRKGGHPCGNAGLRHQPDHGVRRGAGGNRHPGADCARQYHQRNHAPARSAHAHGIRGGG